MQNSQVVAYNKISHSEQNICKLVADMKDERLSDLVSRRIRETGIKRTELATKIGVSRTYVTDLANGTAKTSSGQYKPRPEVIEKLAIHLQVDIEEILATVGYSTEKPKKEPKNKMEELAFHYPGIPEQKRDKVDYLIELLDNEIKKIEAEKEKYGE